MLLKSTVINFLKGIPIGIGALIPGVSGGTVAVVLKVFEDILEAVGDFHKHILKSLLTLFPIGLGAAIGIVIVSNPLENFSVEWPFVSKITFCALSLISTILFVKSTLTLRFSKKKCIMLLMGILLAITITYITGNFELDISNNNVIYLMLSGIPLAAALVLPAISFSYMLYFMGMYERTLNAVGSFEVGYLLPLGSGVIIGIFLFSKTLNKVLKRHPEEVYSFVLGFVLFSLLNLLLSI